MYFCITERQGAPKRRGARGNLPSLLTYSTLSKVAPSVLHVCFIYASSCKRGINFRSVVFFSIGAVESASDSAYSYTHFFVAWFVRLSSVAFLHPAWTVQQISMPFGRHTWCIVLDRVPDHPEIWGSNRQPKRALTNCSQTVRPMPPPGECRRGVGWPCHSHSVFCQMNLVLACAVLSSFNHLWLHSNKHMIWRIFHYTLALVLSNVCTVLVYYSGMTCW